MTLPDQLSQTNNTITTTSIPIPNTPTLFPQDRPFLIQAMYNINDFPSTSGSPAKLVSSVVRHYTKYCYDSEDEDRMNEN